MDLRCQTKFFPKNGNASHLVEVALPVVYRIHLRAQMSAEEGQIPITAPNIGDRACREAFGHVCENRLEKPCQYLQR